MNILSRIDTAFANLDNARTYLREQLESGVEIVACAFSQGGAYLPPTAINDVRPPQIFVLSNGIIVDFVIAGPWDMNRIFWKREWPASGFRINMNEAARKLDVLCTLKEDGHYYYDGNEFVRYDPENDADVLTIKMIDPPLYQAFGIPSDNQVA
ncbi:hypothetical protein [Agrobacterium rosae]|uniref:Uncharacterized protein n=1 Tax=Agrobacterium rosae TaxID=1972867 RepID=A0A1R3TRI2_9HYPH|nr:hypothetical protein [Agrobacterium rosae]SCX19526.1 hypothetical protein DSM25559_1856 [Agrobacterium rosae]